MKKFILIVVLFLFSVCFAEEYEQMYVTATVLNGRSSPSKKAQIEAYFDQYDLVTPTGNWSKDHKWVEVYGGEGGTVWCSIKYLSESAEPTWYYNPEKNRKIKIRKVPVNGKVTAYLKGKQKIYITQIVNGWGRCKKGWIDMNYLEVYDDE